MSAYSRDDLHANHVLESSHRRSRRRRAIGVGEESTSTTGLVVPPPIPSTETNNEATPSEPQCVFLCHDLSLIWAHRVLQRSLIESQNLLIADGQFTQVRGHYTNIVLNVNRQHFLIFLALLLTEVLLRRNFKF